MTKDLPMKMEDDDIAAVEGNSELMMLDTPIQVLQHVAVNLCGVPAAEVTSGKLLASLQEDEASSSS